MVHSPKVPMPSEPPPPPPPPSLMGSSSSGGAARDVDAYGAPIGENPAGFSSPPKTKAKQMPSAKTTTSSTNNNGTKPKSSPSSSFFKSCFGGGGGGAGESSVPSSYQKQNAFVTRKASSDGYGSTKIAPPEEDYGDAGAAESYDPNINPNLQRVANSAEGAGTALPELILRMRVINLILCTLAMGLEIPFWLGRAIMLNLSKLVLGVCLCFFALLLCCWEMHVPVVADVIKQNLGIIYNPYGRAVFFVMMGGLCIGQGGLELILGCVILLNALYTIYIPCRYPHYYKAFEDYGEEDVRNIAAIMSARRQGKAWADPQVVEEEKRTLIAQYSAASGE